MSAPDAIRREIVALAQAGLGRHDFAREGQRVLSRSMPFNAMSIVWFDPATGLPVDKWFDTSLTGRAGSRLAEIEVHEADLSCFRQLAASGRRADRLSQATGGNLDRSRRYRERLRPYGLGDELRAVCVGDSGMLGASVMYRERGAPNFTAREVNLLRSLTGGAEEVQRVMLKRDLSVDAGDRDRGLLLLDDEDGIEMADASAAAWLDELRGTGRQLPLVVTAVAGRARAIESGRCAAAATARVRTASGRWVLVRGSVLCNGTRSRTAVTLEAARAPELAGLIAEVYGLTARERRVTELVAQGLSSAAIAARLYLSTYTVTDHLKAIFEKLDVSSRGELVARLFVDHSLGLRAADRPRRRRKGRRDPLHVVID